MCSIIERKVDLLLNESNKEFAFLLICLQKIKQAALYNPRFVSIPLLWEDERAPTQHTAVGIKLLHLSKPISLRISSSGCHSSSAGHACECIEVTQRVFHVDSTGAGDSLSAKVLPRFVQSMLASWC